MAYKDKDKGRATRRAWTTAHRESVRMYNRTYQRAYRGDPDGWAQVSCRNIKARAKKSGIEFDMTPQDLTMPEVCPFTLLPFNFDPAGKVTPQSPSVDRIKPHIGYVRGNVRVISFQANRAKSNITDPAVFDRLAADARLWGLV